MIICIVITSNLIINGVLVAIELGTQ